MTVVEEYLLWGVVIAFEIWLFGMLGATATIEELDEFVLRRRAGERGVTWILRECFYLAGLSARGLVVIVRFLANVAARAFRWLFLPKPGSESE